MSEEEKREIKVGDLVTVKSRGARGRPMPVTRIKTLYYIDNSDQTFCPNELQLCPRKKAIEITRKQMAVLQRRLDSLGADEGVPDGK